MPATRLRANVAAHAPALGASQRLQTLARRSRDGQALSLFADMLREARHKAGLSSDDLGNKLGYSGALIRAR